MHFPLLKGSVELVSMPTLAYLGDAVFELLVRERLLADGVRHSSRIHHRALRLSSASGQAIAMRALLPMLNEQEQAVYRRGRNAALSMAKKKNPAVHTAASGLETLFGWLYLHDRRERMLELFASCVEAVETQRDP